MVELSSQDKSRVCPGNSFACEICALEIRKSRVATCWFSSELHRPALGSPWNLKARSLSFHNLLWRIEIPLLELITLSPSPSFSMTFRLFFGFDFCASPFSMSRCTSSPSSMLSAQSCSPFTLQAFFWTFCLCLVLSSAGSSQRLLFEMIPTLKTTSGDVYHICFELCPDHSDVPWDEAWL